MVPQDTVVGVGLGVSVGRGEGEGVGVGEGKDQVGVVLGTGEGVTVDKPGVSFATIIVGELKTPSPTAPLFEEQPGNTKQSTTIITHIFGVINYLPVDSRRVGNPFTYQHD